MYHIRRKKTKCKLKQITTLSWDCDELDFSINTRRDLNPQQQSPKSCFQNFDDYWKINKRQDEVRHYGYILLVPTSAVKVEKAETNFVI